LVSDGNKNIDGVLQMHGVKNMHGDFDIDEEVYKP
jgi:hypothetical protein